MTETDDPSHTQPRKDMSGNQHIKVSEEGKLQHWLDKRFRNELTKKGYKVALTRFLKSVYGETTIPFRQGINIVSERIDKYLSENRNFLEDFSNYLLWMNKHHAPRTIVSDAFIVRKFFSRHDHKISDDEWDDLQTLFPANVAITQDDILTKEQFRAIMNHLYITGRALTLFLVSTGARIGETLQLKLEDLNLDADPPSANIRAEYSKKGVGKRIVWMSYEARDAIKEWLKIKDSMKKRAVGGTYRSDIVFPFKYLNFRVMWTKALGKVGLDKQDPKTNHHFYHIHTIRKFFNTKMKESGVHSDIVNAWLGHKGYLPMYDKFGKKKMAEIYKDHMGAVSIYVSDEETSQSQVIITEEELNGYLATGWMFKATLPSSKIVVEGKPGMLKPSPLEEEQKPSKPQSSKSEAVTSSKPISKPPLMQHRQRFKEMVEKTEFKQPEPKRDECVRGLKVTQWDIACGNCRTMHKLDYVKCDAPQKPKIQMPQRW